MQGFYITISNGLLKDQHRKRMGTAVWEFMWLLDRVTSIDEEGIGKVLGGKPINLEDIAKDLGVDAKTVSRNLTSLHSSGYIRKIRTPNGLSIRLMKAQKTFNQKREKTVKGQKCPLQGKGQKCPIDRTEMSFANKDKTVTRQQDKDASEKTLAPKTKSDHVLFIDFYWKATQVTRGIKPVITGADGANLKRILKMDIERTTLERVTLYFLADPDFKKFSPSISTFTSAGILNGLLNRMTNGNDEDFWRKFSRYEETYLPKIYETVAEVKRPVANDDPDQDRTIKMTSMKSCMENLLERFAKPGAAHNYQQT